MVSNSSNQFWTTGSRMSEVIGKCMDKAVFDACKMEIDECYKQFSVVDKMEVNKEKKMGIWNGMDNTKMTRSNSVYEVADLRKALEQVTYNVTWNAIDSKISELLLKKFIAMTDTFQLVAFFNEMYQIRADFGIDTDTHELEVLDVIKKEVDKKSSTYAVKPIDKDTNEVVE